MEINQETEKEKIGLDGSPTRVTRVFTPEKRKKGILLKGPPAEMADKIIELSPEYAR